MSTEIIDFMTPNKLFELEFRGFVVLSFDIHGITLIKLSVYCNFQGSVQALLYTEITHFRLKARYLAK